MRNIILLVLVLLVSASCAEANVEKYFSRSDCIVKVELDWPNGVTREQKNKTIGLVISYISKSNRASKFPIFSLSVPYLDRNSMYIVFSERCDTRLALAQEFMKKYLQIDVKNFPKYKVLSDVIQPGLETVEFSGPYWKQMNRSIRGQSPLQNHLDHLPSPGTTRKK